MISLSFALVIWTVVLFIGAESGVNRRDISGDVGLHSVELIKKYGYPVESHYVTTEDGYILTLHRIPYSKNVHTNNSTNGFPVLLVHGLMSTSADFINMGPKSLGFVLADAGYDVWLVNTRGNFWSQNHTTLDPKKDKAKFWGYSWHEIGVYDLPASIDHILATNGHKSLHYIGHSQGTTVFFVMASSRPQYNSKIKMASLLAPTAILKNNANNNIKLISRFIPALQSLVELLGIYELPYTRFLRKWGVKHCVKPEYEQICLNLLIAFESVPDEPEPVMKKIPVILTNAPGGGASKQFIHYGQLISKGGFDQFDYGPAKNMRKYGSIHPPAYNMSKITAPVAIYYAKNDRLINVKDAELTCSKLPNLVMKYLVPSDYFTHVDFVYGDRALPLVYDKLLATMYK